MKFLKQCQDDCEMYLVECNPASPHYGVLRCRTHGFIKWLSESQYDELHTVMYPQKWGITADEFLNNLKSS